jgi:CHRD domain
VKKSALYALLAAGAIASVSTASLLFAQDSSHGRARAILEGFEEVPAISTTGRGSFDAKVDPDAGTIEWELTYSDLEGIAPAVPGGVVTAAHIHVGQRGVNGGVSAFFCGGGGKPACPTSGTLTGVITAADVLGPAVQGVEAGSFAELVHAIRAGKTYVNVHTTRWPGGEIRSQVSGGGQGSD